MNLVELSLSCVCGPDDPGARVVDCCLLKVAVDPTQAEAIREQFVAELQKPRYQRVRQGCSFIHAGAEIGDQRNAFVVFAVGEVLGLWEVFSPANFRKFADAPKDVKIRVAGDGLVYNMLPQQMKKLREWGAVAPKEVKN